MTAPARILRWSGFLEEESFDGRIRTVFIALAALAVWVPGQIWLAQIVIHPPFAAPLLRGNMRTSHESGTTSQLEVALGAEFSRCGLFLVFDAGEYLRSFRSRGLRALLASAQLDVRPHRRRRASTDNRHPPVLLGIPSTDFRLASMGWPRLCLRGADLVPCIAGGTSERVRYRRDVGRTARLPLPHLLCSSQHWDGWQHVAASGIAMLHVCYEVTWP